MSAIGPKRTSRVATHMSAFGSKADMIFLRRECLLLTQSGACDHSGLKLIWRKYSRIRKDAKWRFQWEVAMTAFPPPQSAPIEGQCHGGTERLAGHLDHALMEERSGRHGRDR